MAILLRGSSAMVPLNPAQKRAVEHFAGPLLVLAGAGSGKTRVITERIARLTERGIPARSILALTFTNKAAGEMAARVHAIGKARSLAVREATISTFHSFGLAALSRERTAIGGSFTIFDQGDSLGVVKDCMRRVDAGRRFDAPAILARISLAKNAFIDPEAFASDESDDEYDVITRDVYPRYQAALRGFRAFDFDDLVCELVRLLRSREDVLARFHERYRFILVDEYQDTNVAQLELLRLLGRRDKNVCVVGDDDQAIYGWRGADVRNILEFEEHFPGAVVVKLEQNYRSRPEILAVANAVIEKRTDAAKHRKTLFSTKGASDKPIVLACSTPEAEAAHVGREIRRLTRDEHVRPSQIAVLYRSNGQARPIEEALREQGVGYRIVGGQQFFERKEVKDVLSYLKLVLHGSDEIALRRVVNYPARGIGEQSLVRLASEATARGWSLWQAVERADAIDDLPSVARSGCADLESVIVETRKKLSTERLLPSVVVRWLCERVRLREDVNEGSAGNASAARRWGNVDALVATLARREERERTAGRDPCSENGLRSFVQAMMLDTSDDGDESAPKDLVLLSTLHGSKGLEFDHVHLIGCEEGYLPHARTQVDKATDAMASEIARDVGVTSDIEEERRLFYVGITRARERLTLSYCEARAMRGKAAARTPSRFLSDVAEALVTRAVCRDARPMTAEESTTQANALLAALEGLG
jgi:superfamily I DNA/RNA helicase